MRFVLLLLSLCLCAFLTNADVYKTLTPLNRVLPFIPDAYDDFGTSVALDGSGKTLIVGASRYYSSGMYHRGAAFVMKLNSTSGNGVSHEQIQKFVGASSYYYFGTSVAVSSDGRIVVVGAPGDYTSSNIRSAGAAYVYKLNQNTQPQQYQQIQRIQASDADYDDQFGINVTLSSNGSVILVGAWWGDGEGSMPRAGKAYVFKETADGQFAQHQLLVGTGLETEDHFGNAVAISADARILVVGASQGRSGPSGGHWRAGAVYAFRLGENGMYSETQRIVADYAVYNAYDSFGSSLSLNANASALLIGAYQHSSSRKYHQGGAYLFQLEPSTGLYSQARLFEGAASYDELGCSVGLSANGNMGIVGSRRMAKTPLVYPYVFGGAYLFDELNGARTHVVRPPAQDAEYNSRFGSAVAMSGDGNTIAIGASRYDVRTSPSQMEHDAGAVFVGALRCPEVGFQPALSSSSMFCVNLFPVIFSLWPAAAPVSGLGGIPIMIMINGDGFEKLECSSTDIRVRFGFANATVIKNVTSVSSMAIECAAPSTAATGTASVDVMCLDHLGSANSTATSTFTFYGPYAVSSFSPLGANELGGDVITIMGTGLDPGWCRFDELTPMQLQQPQTCDRGVRCDALCFGSACWI